ncbi:MAG: SH3 domain-containing protein [Clostridiales bacterium]|nr:SH3 domain-containing protein [Clostridiales bacterium]
MRKPIFLLLALLLLFSSLPCALAADPAIPADEDLVHSLLPEYTLVEGHVYKNQMRLLMRKADNTLVFVGCLQTESGAWITHQSSPLPEGTILGVENFVDSLGIPSGDYFFTVSVSPDAAGVWGVSMFYPNDGSLFQSGTNWISDGVHPVEGLFGTTPWSNLAHIDWLRLPASYEEAAALLNTERWAVVSNPNPADRLHLRTEQSRSAASLGKYYNGTPVRVLKRDGNWTQVEICGITGWMMTEFLAFRDDMKNVEYAGPWLHHKNESTALYFSPDKATITRMADQSESLYVMGIVGQEWYHVWLPYSNEFAYVTIDSLTPGNG